MIHDCHLPDCVKTITHMRSLETPVIGQGENYGAPIGSLCLVIQLISYASYETKTYYGKRQNGVILNRPVSSNSNIK